MTTDLRRFYEALMVHFTEAPASRHDAKVVVEARGFTLVLHEDGPMAYRVEVSGEATDDHCRRLARANDLMQRRLLPLIAETDMDLATRVALAEESHPWRPRFRPGALYGDASYLGRKS